MIELHRLGAGPAPFHLNPDLIVTVEATPDTTIALTTGTKVMVAEGVEAVVAGRWAWGARGRSWRPFAPGAPAFSPARTAAVTRPTTSPHGEDRQFPADDPKRTLM